MEPIKKLKLIPLHQFFKIMDGPGKALYLVLFVALLASAVGMFIASNDPSQWVLSIDEVHTTEPELVELRSYEQNYRKMETEITAWKEDAVFFASPMTPKSWIIFAFVVLQVLGWGYLMTAASYIKNFVGYAAFFLYAIAIFLSKAFEAIAPDQYWLFNLGLAVLIFVPAYLLQQGILKLGFALRLALFLAITAFPFILSYAFKGWLGLHGASVGMFPVLAFVVIAYFLFISKDISQLMFFVGTNLPKQSWRAKFPVFFAVFLVIEALEFLMLHNAMGWQFLAGAEQFPVRPIHLLVVVSILMPGINQNLSFVVKDNMDNRSFSTLITALGLVATSAIFLHIALGEYLFLYALDRMLSLLFFIAGLLHFFYMYYNFGPMLKARMNFYYLSMMPKRLMFVFVVAATLLLSLGFEASEGMKTQRLFAAVAYNRHADHEMLEGRFVEATALYNAACASALGTVKGNYNQAMLMMRTGGAATEIKDLLARASGFIPFAPAWLNLGNLEMEGGVPSQAKYYLRKGWEMVKTPELANNLAQAHLLMGEPDSAIISMKEALRLAPEMPVLYANMGKIYLDHGKYKPAEEFLKAGLALPEPGSAVATNALLLNMVAGTELVVPESLLQQAGMKDSRSAMFNFAVERYKRRDFEGASALLDSMLITNETPDALLLDGMIRFEQGDIGGAISRMEFMDVNHRNYMKFTNHFLGVGFFNAGVPELAASFFAKSVENGRQDDLINQAYMEIDRGDHEYGYMLLNQTRTQDSSLFDLVAREEALLQVATGEYFFASLGFDLGTLTPSEWVRAGIYAGQKGNRPAALEAFRHAIELDSTAVAPYLEMGKISIELGDSLAAENLLPGLKHHPKDIGLRVQLARAALVAGNRAEGEKYLADLEKEAKDDFGVRCLKAEITALKGDTASAMEQYQALYKLQPLASPAVLGLARLMRAKRMDFEGQNLMNDVLGINPRNPDYWYEMAQFERLLDRREEVARAAQSAIGLETNPARAKAIAEEFKLEITEFPAPLIEN
jgi:predicted Zn-dependent protease